MVFSFCLERHPRPCLPLPFRVVSRSESVLRVSRNTREEHDIGKTFSRVRVKVTTTGRPATILMNPICKNMGKVFPATRNLEPQVPVSFSSSCLGPQSLRQGFPGAAAQAHVSPPGLGALVESFPALGRWLTPTLQPTLKLPLQPLSSLRSQLKCTIFMEACSDCSRWG